MHRIELAKQTGNTLQHEIVYRSRSYDKAVNLFLRMVSQGKAVVLVSKTLKQITSKAYQGGKV